MSVVLSSRLAALALAGFATIAAAQTRSLPRAFVQITAKDSSGAVIPSAEIVVTRGLKEVVAQGTTNDEGKSVVSVEVKDSTDFQVTMRKIGYVRSDRFFGVGPHDTARVTIVAARAKSTALAPVVVTADADPKWKSYHLDADDIDRATMPLDNGWEIIKRLRPDMLTSRGGCATGVQNVWVNGKRIRLPLMPTGMVAARARVGVPARARFSYVPVSVMSEIAPEHIQEINYHDCFDHSMAAVGNNDAIFVTLKPGIEYQVNVGSFVADPPAPPTRP
jgi:hypothetical protein